MVCLPCSVILDVWNFGWITTFAHWNIFVYYMNNGFSYVTALFVNWHVSNLAYVTSRLFSIIWPNFIEIEEEVLELSKIFQNVTNWRATSETDPHIYKNESCCKSITHNIFSISYHLSVTIVKLKGTDYHLALLAIMENRGQGKWIQNLTQ